MMHGIDISNWQKDLKIASVWDSIDFCICKATEGTSFVDRYCDPWMQTLIAGGKPCAFYHFAGNGTAYAEADYFVRKCKGYFGKAIPILDWEGEQEVSWVNKFVKRVHDKTGVWCWIYANPWRFNSGNVNKNCMRWIASYPNVEHPTFANAEKWKVPAVPGMVGAWQFCSDGRLKGYSGNLDFSIYYGNAASWSKYVKGDN